MDQRPERDPREEWVAGDAQHPRAASAPRASFASLPTAVGLGVAIPMTMNRNATNTSTYAAKRNPGNGPQSGTTGA